MPQPTVPAENGHTDHWHAWPRYAAAATGLRNYWYPLMWSRDLTHRPVARKLCGDPIMLIREHGKPYAFYNQCPHRGIPLSVGRQDFPGTWSCRYHGWVFDLATGTLKAALTDGPDSPICGKVRAKTYPVEDRAGLVWVYVGDEPPPPVEADVPREFLAPDAVVVGRISLQRGNWRYACENGYDPGHAAYLHRYDTPETWFRDMAPWRRLKPFQDPDGNLVRGVAATGQRAEYPGLGVWPPKHFWQRSGGPHKTTIRLPGILRIKAPHDAHARWVWWTPVDRDHYRMLQFFTRPAHGLTALKFRLSYALLRKPIHHVLFNNQDAWMVRLAPETAPERLYRPDVAITAWRKLVETQARGLPPPPVPLDAELARLADEPTPAGAPAQR
jgi:phenylpropionate dioxygenase-like ring-hydroxylating dioxygenase large terminal subunit